SPSGNVAANPVAPGGLGSAGGPMGGPAVGGSQGSKETATPLVVASVGTLSGPLGGVLLPILNGAQVWVNSINQRGGLNGHRVELVAYDDGGDTARHRAQLQEAIERK